MEFPRGNKLATALSVLFIAFIFMVLALYPRPKSNPSPRVAAPPATHAETPKQAKAQKVVKAEDRSAGISFKATGSISMPALDIPAGTQEKRLSPQEVKKILSGVQASIEKIRSGRLVYKFHIEMARRMSRQVYDEPTSI